MIVPGSPLVGYEHYFSWYATVQEREGAKKKFTYWFNGSQINRQAVTDHLRIFFRNVDVLEIQPCHKMPTKVLQPVPKRHFNFGLLDGPEDGENDGSEQEALWQPGQPRLNHSIGEVIWKR